MEPGSELVGGLLWKVSTSLSLSSLAIWGMHWPDAVRKLLMVTSVLLWVVSWRIRWLRHVSRTAVVSSGERWSSISWRWLIVLWWRVLGLRITVAISRIWTPAIVDRASIGVHGARLRVVWSRNLSLSCVVWWRRPITGLDGWDDSLWVWIARRCLSRWTHVKLWYSLVVVSLIQCLRGCLLYVPDGSVVESKHRRPLFCTGAGRKSALLKLPCCPTAVDRSKPVERDVELGLSEQ